MHPIHTSHLQTKQRRRYKGWGYGTNVKEQHTFYIYEQCEGGAASNSKEQSTKLYFKQQHRTSAINNKCITTRSTTTQNTVWTQQDTTESATKWLEESHTPQLFFPPSCYKQRLYKTHPSCLSCSEWANLWVVKKIINKEKGNIIICHFTYMHACMPKLPEE